MFRRKLASLPEAAFRIAYGATSSLQWWALSRRSASGYWDFLATYKSPEDAEAAIQKHKDVRYYDLDGNRIA